MYIDILPSILSTSRWTPFIFQVFLQSENMIEINCHILMLPKRIKSNPGSFDRLVVLRVEH